MFCLLFNHYTGPQDRRTYRFFSSLFPSERAHYISPMIGCKAVLLAPALSLRLVFIIRLHVMSRHVRLINVEPANHSVNRSEFLFSLHSHG